jgi:hypothetical protein
MKRISIFVLIILVSGGACIEPINLNVGSGGGKLVIDGLVLNLRGPYQVSLGRSLSFDSGRPQGAYFVPESNALVSIVDGKGNSYNLSEKKPGIYQTNTNDFTGEVGESYQVKIQTIDGTQYESAPEIMPAVPAVAGLLYEYHVYDRLIINSQGVPYVDKEYGFKFSVIVNDPGSERNYYRWKSNGIFEYYSVIDFPDLATCWAPIFQLEKSIVINDDRYVNGNSFTKEVSIIPYERETKFLARVEQMSLSQRAFDFWNEILKQTTATGSIFDPAPAMVKGNMYNPNDLDEVVLGYFGASAVYKDSVLFDRFKVSGYVSASPRKPTLNGDCRPQEPFATNVRPSGFK